MLTYKHFRIEGRGCKIEMMYKVPQWWLLGVSVFKRWQKCLAPKDFVSPLPVSAKSSKNSFVYCGV